MNYLAELALKILREEQAPLTDKETRRLDVLTDVAFDALASGVTMSMKDYAFLSRLERKALADASRRLTVLNAQINALAQTGDIGRGALMAEFDGGAELERAYMDAIAGDLDG